MDKLTPETFNTFLWVAAALVVFASGVLTLVKLIREIRKPAADTTHDMAVWRQTTNAKLANDKTRIDNLEEGQKAICRGVLALLNHEITGNSVDKLKDAQSGLTEYLIER